MPELPEVETVRSLLDARLVGAEIVGFELRRPDLRRPMPADALAGLGGRRCVAVRRRAKYLCVDLDPRPGAGVAGLLVHLGMSGRLYLSEPGDAAAVTAERGAESARGVDDPPPFERHEHWRATLRLHGQMRWLRYEDARRFGVLDVLAGDGAHPLLDHLGVEPLSAAFDGRWLHARSRGVRAPIKALLMDARAVVGVGNIYASEACYRAAVDPHAAAGGLSARQADALVDAVVAVLRDAIADGGTTLRDFVSGDRSPGYFQQRLDVYAREGELCRRCEREGRVTTIVKETLQGRSTFRCPRCQRTPRRSRG